MSVARYKANVEEITPPKRKAELFKKGAPRPSNAGRKKGTPNKTTAMIKDALTGAMEQLGALEPIYDTRNKPQSYRGKPGDRIVGWKPTGKGGAQGYLVWLGAHYPNAFTTIINKTLPLQINASGTMNLTPSERFSDTNIKRMSLAEKMACMTEMIGLTKALEAPAQQDPRNKVIDGTFSELPPEVPDLKR